MPRSGGNYTLPEAAFIPNKAISSAAVNSDFSDVADALTGSLARDGQGGMTAVLPMANTGFSYLTDPNTGMRRTAADTQAISAGGVDTITVTSTGVSVTGALAVSGAVTSGGAALIPIGLGPLPWSGLTAPTKWVLASGQTLLRASYPDFWTFAAAEIAAGNTLYTNGNGSTTFTVPDLRGRIPAGKDNMGGSAANRLTGTVISPNANTLGAVGGAQTVGLLLSELPTGITSANTGSIALSVATADNVTHSAGAISSAQAGGAQAAFSLAGSTTGILNSTGTIGIGSAAVTSNNTSGVAHNNVQPTIIVNYIIYAGA